MPKVNYVSDLVHIVAETGVAALHIIRSAHLLIDISIELFLHDKRIMVPVK